MWHPSRGGVDRFPGENVARGLPDIAVRMHSPDSRRIVRMVKLYCTSSITHVLPQGK